MKNLTFVVGVLSVGLLLGGCSDGSDGADGLPGAPGSSTAMVSGTVVNATTSAPLSGVTIQTDPVVPGVVLVTDATGRYSGELPIGPYDLTCKVTNYNDGTHAIKVVADVPVTMDFAMEPVAPVILSVSKPPAGVEPGDSFDLTVTATPMDGSVVTGYQWVQSASVQATIHTPLAATTTITLGSPAAYKAELFAHLDDLARWQVQGLSPFAIEEAGHTAFKVTVTTDDGTHTSTYSYTTDVHAHLEFAAINPGLQTVPRGKAVLLNGKMQGSYNWALAAPAGSTATLMDATTRQPWFVPDVLGRYTLTVTQLSPNEVITLNLYAGNWVGGILGMTAEGYPEIACGVCHADEGSEWQKTGHAHIFSTSLNTNDHYSSNCFSCHTVGFDTSVANGGMDDASDYAAFYADMFGGHHVLDPGNWDYMLSSYPTSARKANIQCENCHGPNDNLLHQDGSFNADKRISLSSDVCGTCHGEPPRHGRFQQWEESPHANYEVAVDESWEAEDGEFRSCGACHSANGFVAWGEDGSWDPDWSPPADLVAGPDHIHPQTCVTCHDPHDVGTQSGDANDAPMRIEGDTPELMAGFTARAVGRGAVCMTCHNSRRGFRNDLTWDSTKGSDPDRATHGGPQTDVLFGENAYFVEVGVRGKHSIITDTCTNCHMERTDPPADFSYNLSGTNHDFRAKESICAECHGAFTADALVTLFEEGLEHLKHELEEGIRNEIERQLLAGNWVRVAGLADPDDEDSDIQVVITNFADVGEIGFTESHGRQAMDITVGATTVYHVRMSSDTRVYPAGGAPGTLTLYKTPGGEVLARAGWNYFLLHSDGSHGIHNPTYAGAVLEGAIEALAEEYGN